MDHATRDFGRGLGLLVCNTPSYSPESSGMAEAFVKTFKRDYIYVNELPSAAHVLAQLSVWFEDYNQIAPRRGLKMLSPANSAVLTTSPELSGLTGATPAEANAEIHVNACAYDGALTDPKIAVMYMERRWAVRWRR